jgi:hypothetical protein
MVFVCFIPGKAHKTVPHQSITDRAEVSGVPAPVPALWTKTHQNHKNLWLYTAAVLLMMDAVASETCRA